MRKVALGQPKAVHRHAWIWEPLEELPGFVLRSMFGSKAVYLEGKMIFAFCARTPPWRGILICTEREHQPSLMAEFPVLKPHKILPKWLYLPESSESFDTVAEKLVRLVLKRDARIGVIPKPKKRAKARKAG